MTELKVVKKILTKAVFTLCTESVLIGQWLALSLAASNEKPVSGPITKVREDNIINITGENS